MSSESGGGAPPIYSALFCMLPVVMIGVGSVFDSLQA